MATGGPAGSRVMVRPQEGFLSPLLTVGIFHQSFKVVDRFQILALSPHIQCWNQNLTFQGRQVNLFVMILFKVSNMNNLVEVCNVSC